MSVASRGTLVPEAIGALPRASMHAYGGPQAGGGQFVKDVFFPQL